MIARRAGNLFQSKRHIRLCPKVELHVGVHWKGVETFPADAAPVAVRSHKSFIDGKVGLFAHGALDRIQSSLYFLLRQGDHMDVSIAGGEMKSQPVGCASEIA